MKILIIRQEFFFCGFPLQVNSLNTNCVTNINPDIAGDNEGGDCEQHHRGGDRVLVLHWGVHWQGLHRWIPSLDSPPTYAIFT